MIKLLTLLINIIALLLITAAIGLFLAAFGGIVLLIWLIVA